MAVFPKKEKAHAPVLSKDALLVIKRQAWQQSDAKLSSLAAGHADLLKQKAVLEKEHHNELIAAGMNEDPIKDDANRAAVEQQLGQVRRKTAAVEAAIGHQQAIHAELTRELNALQQEISQRKYREYMANLQTRLLEKKEQLIAHLYGGCGLLAELVKLADEAHLADDRALSQGDPSVINAGRRFVQQALEDLNLRTTPIIMTERAGFVPVRSSLAFAQRAYEVRALVPPEKG